MAEAASSADHAEHQHEERDVPLRPLIFLGVGLVLLAGAVLVLLVLLFDYLAARRIELTPQPSPLLETGRLPPQPRLQVLPQRDRRLIHAAENAVLQSYGWV